MILYNQEGATNPQKSVWLGIRETETDPAIPPWSIRNGTLVLRIPELMQGLARQTVNREAEHLWQ